MVDMQTYNYVGNIYRVEILLDNLVNKDIQAMLMPLNLIQNILFYPKYSIRDNYITPNNRLSNFMSLCATLIFSGSYIYRSVTKAYYANIYLDYFNVFEFYADSLYYCVGFVMNFIISLGFTSQSLQFVLMIQDVHKNINDRKIFQKYVIGNWISVTVMLCYYGSVILCVGIYSSLSFNSVFTFIAVMSFDMNIIYAIRLFKLLKDKVDLWSNQNVKVQEEETKNCQNLFEDYIRLMKCYNIFRKTFQYFILYQTIDTFGQTLINVELSIRLCKEFTPELSIGTIATYSWLVKNFILQIELGTHCELFYLAVDNAQDTCAVILGTTCSDEERKLCKNIQRVHKASFSKMTACGLFHIDAMLPLSLMGLLTNYTIVLLQFAFR